MVVGREDSGEFDECVAEQEVGVCGEGGAILEEENEWMGGEKMGWMLETRMLNLMFKMVVRRMLTVMVLIVNLSR